MQQLAQDDLPDWFFDKVNWYASPPDILVTQQDFFFENVQVSALASQSTNEIVIFSFRCYEGREETLAHEVAHFMLPANFPGHGPVFLAQFAYLLEQAGKDDDQIARSMHRCIEQNWWKKTPKFLKRRAFAKAVQLFTKGAEVPRREPGWVHLFSGGVGGALHHLAAVLVAKVAGAAVLTGWLAGPFAGVAAGVAVAATLLA